MYQEDYMEYRKAKTEDIPSLSIMRIAYLEEDNHGLSKEQIEQIESQLSEYFQRNLNQNLFAYICEDKQRVVAAVLMLVTEKPANPSFMTGKIGTMLNVYTCPEYRRKGIAKKLMQMAMKEAEEMSLSYLELKATSDGEFLYQSLGFKKEISHYVPMKYEFKNGN